MNGTALGFVLIAAIVHAAWNLVAKGVGGGGARFVFLYYTVSALACVPFTVISLLHAGHPQWSWLLAAVVTAVFHLGYAVVLQRGYAVGDMSVVYPVARGTGPLLSVFAAVVLLHERPGWHGILGAVFVIAGVFVISSGSRGSEHDPEHRRRTRLVGLGYGLLTGVTIAAYTLWDAHSVNALAVPPMVYFGAGAVLQSLFLAPYALAARATVVDLLRTRWRSVLAVGLLSPIGYLLVLFAMREAPVSLVAPARELSIVLGGLAAWRVFGESNPVRRVIGSVIVLGGIAAIAVA